MWWLAFFFVLTTGMLVCIQPGHRWYEWKWMAVAVNAVAFGLIAFANGIA